MSNYYQSVRIRPSPLQSRIHHNPKKTKFNLLPQIAEYSKAAVSNEWYYNIGDDNDYKAPEPTMEQTRITPLTVASLFAFENYARDQQRLQLGRPHLTSPGLHCKVNKDGITREQDPYWWTARDVKHYFRWIGRACYLRYIARTRGDGQTLLFDIDRKVMREIGIRNKLVKYDLIDIILKLRNGSEFYKWMEPELDNKLYVDDNMIENAAQEVIDGIINIDAASDDYKNDYIEVEDGKEPPRDSPPEKEDIDDIILNAGLFLMNKVNVNDDVDGEEEGEAEEVDPAFGTNTGALFIQPDGYCFQISDRFNSGGY